MQNFEKHDKTPPIRTAALRATPMQILQHLIDLPDDIEPYEPLIQHAPMEALLYPPKDARAELKARARTTATLFQHGMEATMDDTEELVAQQQFHKHVQQLPINTATLGRPGVIMKLAALLSEYDHEVVRDATQIRTYVTNRLLEESDPKMPASQRLRALDLLGKITEVGLFTERTEITVKSMPMESLEAALHARLITLLPEEFSSILEPTTDASPAAA